eukprot:jgi/Mesvir1/7378/Mv19179-RA.1
MKDNDIMKDNARQAKRLPIAALFHAIGDMLQEVVDDISKRNSRGKATQGGPANADIVSSSSSSDEEDEEEEEPAYNDDGKVYKFDSVKLEGGVMHVRTRFSDLTMAWLPLSKIDSQYDARMRDFLKNFRGSANVAPGNRVTAKMARDAWAERMQPTRKPSRPRRSMLLGPTTPRRCSGRARLWRKPLGKLEKQDLFKVLVLPVLTYGAGRWTLTADLAIKLDGAVTNMLRSIFRAWDTLLMSAS